MGAIVICIAGFTIPPAPARRFAFEPTHRDQRRGQAIHCDEIICHLSCWRKDDCDRGKQREERRPYHPSLPPRRDTPAPAIASGRKPILRGSNCGWHFHSLSPGRVVVRHCSARTVLRTSRGPSRRMRRLAASVRQMMIGFDQWRNVDDLGRNAAGARADTA